LLVGCLRCVDFEGTRLVLLWECNPLVLEGGAWVVPIESVPNPTGVVAEIIEMLALGDAGWWAVLTAPFRWIQHVLFK
jgi:hypothetical protein